MKAPGFSRRDCAGLLTLRLRRTCVLAWVEGQTHAEIAVVQGVSSWATKKRVQRARRKLHVAGIMVPPRLVKTRVTAFQLGVIENV